MSDFGFGPWAFIVLGGIIVLGIAIAYGAMRNSQRTRAEKMASERATHQLYEREDKTA
jgi:hypothetical protein